MGKLSVLILGGDGYLGWPTAMHFASRGHDVHIIDNMAKRKWEAEVGAEPLFPIPPLKKRVGRWNSLEGVGAKIKAHIVDIATNSDALNNVIENAKPDAIIHYAEQPSAPYSMISRSRAMSTINNNINGTINVVYAIRNFAIKHGKHIHLVKLGTMGEYGTPNIAIEEGWIEITHEGRKDRMLYPKKPGSFYHASKVADSTFIESACRFWPGFHSTDLNQGVVYGVSTPQTDLHPELVTSFHYDAVFGTALNRFVTQAVVGHPLTVYGEGGQTRGYLNILDTLQCIELAVLHPAKSQEFRVLNQFTEQFSVNELAAQVKRVGESMELDVKIDHLDNPRVEMEKHFYNAKHSELKKLGLEPHFLTDEVVRDMIVRVQKYADHVDKDSLVPKVNWRPPNILETYSI